MFKLITGTTLAIIFLASCDMATSNADDSSTIAASCAACHSGKRGFAGRDADEIAGLIREIMDGEFAHPPLGIDDTSDEAIAALARRLTAE